MTDRVRLRSTLLILTLGLSTWSVSGQSTPPASPSLPRVRLVATGGTISNRAGGRLSADDLVKLLPDVRQWAIPEAEQFSNLASAQLTLDQWIGISKRVNELLRAEDGPAGVVVTSGTDTLEELAYFLDLTVRSDKPVVVVGSMRNPSTLGYEGAANLEEAFRVAADPASRGRGALVVLNDEINAAREVTKTDALRLETFQSRVYGILGVVDADRVVYYRQSIKRHTAASEFDVATMTGLPRVDVILVYQGASGDLIKAAVDQGAKGIVVAGAGAGAVSGTQNEGIQYALDKGVFVVTTTRTGGGRIPADRGNRGRSGDGASTPRVDKWIAGEDLSPIKARILLMVALTRTQVASEIQRMFTEY